MIQDDLGSRRRYWLLLVALAAALVLAVSAALAATFTYSGSITARPDAGRPPRP